MMNLTELYVVATTDNDGGRNEMKNQISLDLLKRGSR